VHVSINFNQAMAFLNEAHPWVVVDLEPLVHEEHDADGWKGTLTLSGAQAFKTWAFWSLNYPVLGLGCLGAVSLKAARSLAGTDSLELATSPRFERDLLDWLEDLPAWSTRFEVTDPVLLEWVPLAEKVALPRAWQDFRLDTPVPGIGAGRRELVILPRAAVPPRWDGRVAGGRVHEVLGTLFDDEAQADTALSLWRPGDTTDPMGSFRVVEAIARAL
jgi:hypothetical protein